MKTLIADSGASKTAWALVHGSSVEYRTTRGLHTSWIGEEQLETELREELHNLSPDRIRFYGAGLYGGKGDSPVGGLLRTLFGEVDLEFRDDLQAVADAFLGDRPGVAAILGTGSNSGWFEEGQKRGGVAALGYVLGDEGSGADIGKSLLKGYFRNQWSPSTLEWIARELNHLTYEEMVRKLYMDSRPSYWLASVAGILLKRSERPGELDFLLDEALDRFIREHLMYYEPFPDLEVAICGGVANACQERLSAKLNAAGVRTFHLARGVIEALAANEVNRQRGGS
ncbi:MAG: hypothetical protein ACQER4_08730 [Bacteroidota bacterium]